MGGGGGGGLRAASNAVATAVPVHCNNAQQKCFCTVLPMVVNYGTVSGFASGIKAIVRLLCWGGGFVGHFAEEERNFLGTPGGQSCPQGGGAGGSSEQLLMLLLQWSIETMHSRIASVRNCESFHSRREAIVDCL